MPEYNTFRVGESKRILQTVEAEYAFEVTSVSINIYDSEGNAVVTNGVGDVDSTDSATSHDVWYRWATSGRTPGDYTYLLSYVVGSETVTQRGEITLLPVVSKYDVWVRIMGSWLQETGMGEAQQLLAYRDYMQAVRVALRAYERENPRRVLEEATLSANVWEYDLPESWVNGLSTIEAIEYPVDTDSQTRTYLDTEEYLVDALRGKWMFTENRPAAGEVARLHVTAPHTVDHTTDTLNEYERDWVSMYAAGQALMMLANRAAQTSAPEISADIAGYRSKQQEYAAQAKALMQRAEAGWETTPTVPAPASSASSFVHWGYQEDFGKF